jgi:SAM-dependent methyltransferase
MLFLSETEKREWAEYADEILSSFPVPGTFDTRIRKNLIPAFHFYIGAILAAKGFGRQGIVWLETGALIEEKTLPCCALLRGFLIRHNYRMVKPAIVFKDPRPFIHFASVPGMTGARQQFIWQCGHSLPQFKEPVRFMDIGCGDGALTAALLLHLADSGKIPGIAEILLIDPSPAMTAMAETTVRTAFPNARITVENGPIQDFSGSIDRKYDIAVSSFAYHHMPLEEKRIHLFRLKPWIDHFILFDMEANNDTPEQFTPEIALSVYQSYGRIMDFVCSNDAPEELINDCMDSFLMAEVISILTEPRGTRSDYHMLRRQWNDLFSEVLGPEFSPLCDSAAYSDEYMAIITIHYGRGQLRARS